MDGWLEGLMAWWLNGWMVATVRLPTLLTEYTLTEDCWLKTIFQIYLDQFHIVKNITFAKLKFSEPEIINGWNKSTYIYWTK